MDRNELRRLQARLNQAHETLNYWQITLEKQGDDGASDELYLTVMMEKAAGELLEVMWTVEAAHKALALAEPVEPKAKPRKPKSKSYEIWERTAEISGPPVP